MKKLRYFYKGLPDSYEREYILNEWIHEISELACDKKKAEFFTKQLLDMCEKRARSDNNKVWLFSEFYVEPV